MACAFCQGSVSEVMDFGDVALAGAFLMPEDFEHEERYPLKLLFCHDCYAVQVEKPVDPETLFRNYFYLSSASKTVRDHAHRLADKVTLRYRPQSVVEIGCNDGVLMRELKAFGVPRCVGVDPSDVASDIRVPGYSVINDYFTRDVARSLGPVDMVIACNVFAHVPDINGITQAIAECLTDDGVAVIEVHHLGEMVRGLQYDWIYHEHLYYYSALTLIRHFARHGMTVFDAEPVALHAGSMRYFVSKRNRVQTGLLVEIVRAELEQGLNRIETFKDFAYRVKANALALKAHVAWLKRGAKGRAPKRVCGYGASGRANALIQASGITVDYLIDDSPAKHGYYTPGSHIPIYPREMLKPDDTVLVFAWPYLPEIAPKCQGHDLIVPLPHIATFGQPEYPHGWVEVDGVGAWRAA